MTSDEPKLEFDRRTIEALRAARPNPSTTRNTREDYATRLLGELTDPLDIATVEEWGHAG